MNKNIEINKNQINDSSLELYNKRGYVIIRNFIKKSLIRNIKEKILKKIKINNKFFYYEKINNRLKLRRIERISDFSKKSKDIICSKQILRLIKKIENKRFDLFKDKLNFKYPGGNGYLPHIDGHFFWKNNKNILQNGWQKYSNNFVNLVVPLEESNKANGCIYLSDKRNTNKLGKKFKEITKRMVPNTPNIKVSDIKKFKFLPIELKVGDICFFNWKCAHLSKKNNSKKSRMIFYATYFQKNKKKNIRNKYYIDKLKSKNSSKFKSLLHQ